MPELKNRKQERFCQEFVKDLNATQALIRAGYEEKAATESASRMLRYVSVAERVKELQMSIAEKLGYDQEYVLKMINETGLRCMQAVPVMEWDYELKQFVPKVDGNGNELYTFDSYGANKAWELLGKHIGLFEKDNKQKAGVINVAIIN